MRFRWLNLSLVVNLLLIGFLAWTLHSARTPEISALPNKLMDSPGRPVDGPALDGSPENPAVAGADPDSFDWSQVESPDYRLYAANLRAIGCPNQTIHDIVIADVDALYRLKVKALVDSVQPRFWDLLAHKGEFEEMVEEKYRELQTLDEERETTLKEVLGAEYTHYTTREHLRELDTTNERRQFLDFLPPEKIEATLNLEQTFAERRNHLDNARPPLTNEERQRALLACQAEEAAARAQLLSPEESEEYQLRSSPSAHVRLELSGFGATTEEVKTIVRIRQATAAEAATPANRARRAELQARENEELTRYLGEQRFAEYQRSRDYNFQQLCQLAELCELPAQVALNVYQLRQAAEERAKQLRQNPNLSATQRVQGLQAIAAETERWMNQALGERAFQIYRSRAAGWLESLAVLPK
jgi:hypothetical protein